VTTRRRNDGGEGWDSGEDVTRFLQIGKLAPRFPGGTPIESIGVTGELLEG